MAKTKAAFEGVTFDADPEIEFVHVRVLKRGDGKISTGVHDNRGGDVLYEQGETFTCPRNVAEALEARDFVEIGAVEDDPAAGPRRRRPPKNAE